MRQGDHPRQQSGRVRSPGRASRGDYVAHGAGVRCRGQRGRGRSTRWRGEGRRPSGVGPDQVGGRLAKKLLLYGLWGGCGAQGGRRAASTWRAGRASAARDKHAETEARGGQKAVCSWSRPSWWLAGQTAFSSTASAPTSGRPGSTSGSPSMVLPRGMGTPSGRIQCIPSPDQYNATLGRISEHRIKEQVVVAKSLQKDDTSLLPAQVDLSDINAAISMGRKHSRRRQLRNGICTGIGVSRYINLLWRLLRS